MAKPTEQPKRAAAKKASGATSRSATLSASTRPEASVKIELQRAMPDRDVGPSAHEMSGRFDRSLDEPSGPDPTPSPRIDNGPTRGTGEGLADMDDDYGDGPPPSPSPGGMADPIEAAGGRSISLRSIRDYKPDQPYISNRLADLAGNVIDRFASDSDSSYLMTVEHVVATILADEAQALDSFIGQYFSLARQLELERRMPVRPACKPAISPQWVDEDRVVLRWDVVEVLAEAVKIRQAVHEGPDELGTRHVAIALLTTRSGQAALAAAGLMGQYERVFQHFSEVLQRVDFTHFGDKAEAWLRIALQLLKQQLLIPPSADARVSFAADRAQCLAVDSLGVKEDAAALSDLILLEAAQPPLAIGLFGAWGSGKSTLIKELQARIHADLEQERALVAAGLADTSPDTRRVRHVVQIEFNAWAYADSANLWASLTSEIFDQLAVGGLRIGDGDQAADRRFAELVREVKLRNSRAANALRASENEVADLERRVEIAKQEVKAASDRLSVAGTAISQTAEMLFKREPHSGPTEIYLRTGEVPKKRDKQAIEVVRETLSAGDNAEERIKTYATAANEWALGLRIFFDFVRARKLSRLALYFGAFALGVGLVAGAGMLVTSWYPQSFEWVASAGEQALAWARTIGLGTALVALAATVSTSLPALRVALLFAGKYREQRTAAVQKEAQARSNLASVRAEFNAAVAARDDASIGAAKGDSANAESPAMMLEYLLSDSADVDALRQQLGIVARVRRCFEQLDSIIRRMRADPKEQGGIDRIVLYIDDLDRCDAEQVSNVLQAVHLLLAFECFVVIVAVDARWLKQSLEKHHEQLQPPKVDDPAADGNRATAADYLEKIFQIPLWVRPLVDEDAAVHARYEAYRGFVNALARPARDYYGEEIPSPPPSPPSEPMAEPVPAPHGFDFVDPVRPEQAEMPRREGLRLTGAELLAMEDLGPIAASSPRAVKRMINLYRLLRVRYRGKQLDDFLADGAVGVPSYRELLVALACETGLSAVTRIKLRAALELDRDKPRNDAWSFADVAKLATPRERTRIGALSSHFGNLTRVGMFTAVEEVRRYSFLP